MHGKGQENFSDNNDDDDDDDDIIYTGFNG